MWLSPSAFIFFFFNDTATTEIYTLSLHDALPIFDGLETVGDQGIMAGDDQLLGARERVDRLEGREHLGEARDDLDGLARRSEEHTSELQSQSNLVCRLLLEKKKQHTNTSLCHVAR